MYRPLQYLLSMPAMSDRVRGRDRRATSPASDWSVASMTRIAPPAIAPRIDLAETAFHIELLCPFGLRRQMRLKCFCLELALRVTTATNFIALLL